MLFYLFVVSVHLFCLCSTCKSIKFEMNENCPIRLRFSQQGRRSASIVWLPRILRSLALLVTKKKHPQTQSTPIANTALFDIIYLYIMSTVYAYHSLMHIYSSNLILYIYYTQFLTLPLRYSRIHSKIINNNHRSE